MEEERRHASPEGLRSEKDAVCFIVKHSENEKSATKTTKKHCKIDVFDFHFHCYLHLQRSKNDSITGSHRIE